MRPRVAVAPGVGQQERPPSAVRPSGRTKRTSRVALLLASDPTSATSVTIASASSATANSRIARPVSSEHGRPKKRSKAALLSTIRELLIEPGDAQRRVLENRPQPEGLVGRRGRSFPDYRIRAPPFLLRRLASGLTRHRVAHVRPGRARKWTPRKGVGSHARLAREAVISSGLTAHPFNELHMWGA